MFWKKKVKKQSTFPADWKVEDYIRYDSNYWNIVSFSPNRTSVILKESISYEERFVEVTYSDKLYNKTIGIKRYKEKQQLLKQKVIEWEDYNKALKELQDKFNL